MSNSYITDLTHFLDHDGEIAKEMPSEARNLACFEALIVDKTTEKYIHIDTLNDNDINTDLRCFIDDCVGQIFSYVDESDKRIRWYCTRCTVNGFISNWQSSKWDNTKIT